MIKNPTSISIEQDTWKILSTMKAKKPMPSMESVLQWLLANLNAEAKQEITWITKFIGLPPPFNNSLEVMNQYSLKLEATTLTDAADVLFAKVISERMHDEKELHEIKKKDVATMLDDLINKTRAEGRATLVYSLYSADLVNKVFDKVKGMQYIDKH